MGEKITNFVDRFLGFIIILICLCTIWLSTSILKGYPFLKEQFTPVVVVEESSGIDVSYYNLENILKGKKETKDLVELRVFYKDRTDYETVSIDDLDSVKCVMINKIVKEYNNKIVTQQHREQVLQRAKDKLKNSCN